MEELIGLELNGSKGYFYVSVDGKQEGKMTFVFAGNDKIIIDHTEVNSNFAGQSVGKKLVMKAAKYAKENNLKIIPLCPFAKSVFEKTKEIQDLIF